MINLFKRQEETLDLPPVEDIGLCAAVMTPATSLYNADQLRRLRTLGPKLYKVRKQIMRAKPEDHAMVPMWLIAMNQYHEEICDIVLNGAELGDEADISTW